MGLLSSLTGNVESACLIIKDYRSTSGAGMLGAAAGASKALSGVLSAVAGGSDKTFHVQFNPSEIQLFASNPKVNKADTRKIGDGKRSLSESPVKPTVEMSVNLIFDKVNNTDAFMWDKLNTGLTVNTAVSAVKSLVGKKYTVQPEVEGLIAALRNEYTRNVTFQWAKFSFVGVLKYVSANYTMFSTSGHPIRAKVTLRLRQEMTMSNLQNWYDDVKNAFEGGSSNLVLPQQTVGSVLNLGL
jgi:hypothetical protein